MNDKLEISMNELSHYESLKKQDLEHRKLIKKLQLEIKALKQGRSLPIDSVSNCDHNPKRPYKGKHTNCNKCGMILQMIQ